MPTVELTAGTIESHDTGGDGQVPVLLGGVCWMAKRPLPEELVPDGRLVEVPDSYTLIMRDQPQAFARAVREFVRAAPAVAG